MVCVCVCFYDGSTRRLTESGFMEKPGLLRSMVLAIMKCDHAKK